MIRSIFLSNVFSICSDVCVKSVRFVLNKHNLGDLPQSYCKHHSVHWSTLILCHIFRVQVSVLKSFEVRQNFVSQCIRNVWLEAAAVCKVWQACSLSVHGLFCVVTFTKLLTCLREASCDCPSFADSPHLHVGFPREMKILPQCSTEKVNLLSPKFYI
jgi:hypothetical protein